MSASLVTLGFEAPAAAAAVVSSGPSGIRIYFSMVGNGTGAYTSGQYVAGVDLSGAGVVQISKDGANYAPHAGAVPHSIGGGDYYYELDNSELGVNTVLLKVVLAGFNEVHTEKDLGDPAQKADVTSAVTTLNGSISAAIISIGSSIAAAQTAINAHTDADTTAIETAITNAQTAINAHTDTAVATLETAISDGSAAVNAHTDAAVTAGAATVNAHTDAALVPISAGIQRVLGLGGDNALLDGGPGQASLVYNSKKLLIQGRLRVFASAAALAAATPGAANGADHELFSWSLAGVDIGSGLLKTFTRTRVL